MITREGILNTVFKLVNDRLNKQAESLQYYMKHWNGKNGGIEGWLKVEFVAAIPCDIIKIETGSAWRHGKSTGNRYPDLRLISLESKDIEPINVELKASTNWSPTYGKPYEYYDGMSLFFLCGAPSNTFDAKRHDLSTKGYPFDLARVCEAVQCIDNKAVNFLFGFQDIVGDKRPV